jgi:pyrimidine operon attenuation protein/uracil phosphoribosyltransferase
MGSCWGQLPFLILKSAAPTGSIRSIDLLLSKISTLKRVLSEQQLAITLKRLAHQVIENHIALNNTVLIGIQPRGIPVSDRIVEEIRRLLPQQQPIEYGKLDITFYRDDVRKELHIANQTDIPFTIENKHVVLIDDVLYTGRTIRAALDALLDFGRPASVELCILIDRRFSRELPIQPDYVGKAIDSIISQKVKVYWKEKDGMQEVALLEH